MCTAHCQHARCFSHVVNAVHAHRLQVLATIVSSGLNSLSTYSALWDVESLGLCVELGSVLQRSAALLLQHAAQLPLDQHCCLQVGSAARTASAYASLTLFNTHLYAAMGQTAFLKLADGIRSMIPMFTKTAMELLKACWAGMARDAWVSWFAHYIITF